MTRITNADQILLLLRAQLQRAERARAKPGEGARAGRAELRQGPIERVQDVLGAQTLSGEEMRRALIAAILAEEFGPSVANDPKFQGVVDEVVRAIAGDDESRALLDGALASLRPSEENP